MANGHGGKREGAGRKPGALSEAKKELIEMAKDHGPEALQVLVEVSKDLEAPHSARVSAATAILDRAYGKPHVSADINNTHDVSDPIAELLGFAAKESSRIGVGSRD